ncbi:protein ORF52 [Lake sturgeon herpesvirus]|nr:protein ORF52 [Lake sturgeon herpesvirus]
MFTRLCGFLTAYDEFTQYIWSTAFDHPDTKKLQHDYLLMRTEQQNDIYLAEAQKKATIAKNNADSIDLAGIHRQCVFLSQELYNTEDRLAAMVDQIVHETNEVKTARLYREAAMIQVQYETIDQQYQDYVKIYKNTSTLHQTVKSLEMLMETKLAMCNQQPLDHEDMLKLNNLFKQQTQLSKEVSDIQTNLNVTQKLAGYIKTGNPDTVATYNVHNKIAQRVKLLKRQKPSAVVNRWPVADRNVFQLPSKPTFADGDREDEEEENDDDIYNRAHFRPPPETRVLLSHHDVAH